MQRTLLAFFLFALLYSNAEAQTTTYTQGGLTVDVFVSNPCDGNNNGFIQFDVISTSDNLPVQLQVIIGPPNLFIPQIIPVGSSFKFNASETLPVSDGYEFIIADNSGTDIINTFGSPVFLSSLPDIVATDDLSTNLVNSSCTTPDGQLAVSIAGGSKVLAGGGEFTYSWSSTNGLPGFPITGTTDGNSVLDLATLAGLTGLPGGDYTLNIFDSFSTCLETRNWTITDPQPALQSITNGNTQTVCQGTAATIQLSGSELGVAYEVLVNGVFSGVSSMGTGLPLTILVPAGLFSSGQTLVVRARLGSCTERVMTGFITMTVNPLPTAVASGGGTVCTGSPLPNVTFTFTGTAPFTFTYTDGVTPVNVVNHPTTTFTINNAPAGTYSVTALTDANTCVATSLGAPVSVIVNPLPTAVIAGGGAACTGSPLPNVTFTFTGTAPFTFTYTDGVTPVNVVNHPTTTFTITNAPVGTYSISTLTDANTCVGTSLGTPVSVIVNPLPTAVASGGGTVCTGSPLPNVTFTFTAKTLTFEDLLREITESKQPKQEPVVDYDEELEDEEKDLEEVDYDYRKDNKVYETYEEAKKQAFFRPSLEETMKVEDTVVSFGKFKEFDRAAQTNLAAEYLKDFGDLGSIRKAVVMSEILKRKF